MFLKKVRFLAKSISTERYQRYLSYFFPFDKIDFRDWAFTFFSSFLYYQDYDKLDENERSLYRQGMAAFGGVAPTYHILLCIQMMFSFMLTDDDSSLKVCKHCGKAYAATRSNMEFCSPQCKNQYNVYKRRSKKNNIPPQEV